MSKLLFITPNERGVPRSLGAVSQPVQRGVPSAHLAMELHDKAVTRSAIDMEIANADYVLYFGHGQVDALGAPGKRLVDDQNLASHQVIVALACHSAAGLGPAVFGPGASGAFVGFNKVLLHPARRPSRANQAYENALLVFVAGGLVEKLMVDLESELLAAADDYLGRGTADELLCFAALRSNTLALSLIGNANAVVYSPAASAAPKSPDRYKYVLRMSGDEESNREFLARLRSLPTVEAQTRFVFPDNDGATRIFAWSSELIDELFSSVASDSGTSIMGVTRSLV